jgi:hypothetical protein
MKKTLIMLLILAVCMATQAQNNLFSKYEKVDGVSTVVVSKAMFRMMPNMTIGNRNIKKIASKIDHIKVLSCERSALINKIGKEATAIYTKKPWEEMMRYKEGTENTIIYMSSQGKLYEYVLYTTDKGALQIINIVGNLTLKDIQQIAR